MQKNLTIHTPGNPLRERVGDINLTFGCTKREQIPKECRSNGALEVIIPIQQYSPKKAFKYDTLGQISSGVMTALSTLQRENGIQFLDEKGEQSFLFVVENKNQRFILPKLNPENPLRSVMQTIDVLKNVFRSLLNEVFFQPLMGRMHSLSDTKGIEIGASEKKYLQQQIDIQKTENFKKTMDYWENILGGFEDGLLHIGMILSALINGHRQQTGTLMEVESLKRIANDEGAKLVSDLSFFNIYPMKIFDSFLPEDINPYIFQEGQLGIQSWIFNLLDEVGENIFHKTPCGDMPVKILAIFEKYHIPHEKSQKIAKKTTELVHQYKLHPDSQQTFGCPALNVGILKQWYQYCVDLTMKWYDRELQALNSKLQYIPLLIESGTCPDK